MGSESEFSIYLRSSDFMPGYLEKSVAHSNFILLPSKYAYVIIKPDILVVQVSCLW